MTERFIKLANLAADIYVPSAGTIESALKKATHVAIGAHQDDLEIMAFHGIKECYGRKRKSFVGIVCTDGAGSPRAGKYARFSDRQMRNVRKQEQRMAAKCGKYGAVIQLGYPSSAIKKKISARVIRDLVTILGQARPNVIYTHNLADRHDTHVGVALAVIQALRSLPKINRPKKFYGGEVWGDLDWLPHPYRVELDVTGYEALAGKLIRVFDSQVAGGKRYDLATTGRWQAHATYAHARDVDRARHLMLMMNFGPFLGNSMLTPKHFIELIVQRFRRERIPQLSVFR